MVNLQGTYGSLTSLTLPFSYVILLSHIVFIIILCYIISTFIKLRNQYPVSEREGMGTVGFPREGPGTVGARENINYIYNLLDVIIQVSHSFCEIINITNF